MRLRVCALALCALAFLGLFSGCLSSGGMNVRMDIGGPVENLDPQFSVDQTERMILQNLFEGLVVKGADGRLRPGAAQRWEVSPDGLRYTFFLREDARWEDGEPVTADDFVFAFRRLFSPQAPSPFARDYAVIENAEEILLGNTAVQRLGVSATGDRTLEFSLSRKSDVFLDLLAATPALPCNEKIFAQAKGRYGLQIDYVYSNGPFLLERWDNTKYLYLGRNPACREGAAALPERVTLYIGRENPLNQFQSGKSDLVFLSASDAHKLNAERVRLIELERTVWCVVFGGQGVWNNALLRQALARTVDRSTYKMGLSPWLDATEVMAPPAMRVGGESYRETAGDTGPMPFDAARGQRLYGRALEALELERLPAGILYMPDYGGHEDYMAMLRQGWQKYLGLQVIAEPVDVERMEAILYSGDFGMMLMPFTPAGESPGVLLGAFREGSGQNYFGYRNAFFDNALVQAASAQEPESAIALYRQAEDQLLRDAAVIPVYFETGYCAVIGGISGVEVSPFGGQILFARATKS